MKALALSALVLLAGCATVTAVCEEVVRAQALVDHYGPLVAAVCPQDVEVCDSLRARLAEAEAILELAEALCGPGQPGAVRTITDEAFGARLEALERKAGL